MQMPVSCSRCGNEVELNDTRTPDRRELDVAWCRECMRWWEVKEPAAEEIYEKNREPRVMVEWEYLTLAEKLEWID